MKTIVTTTIFKDEKVICNKPVEFKNLNSSRKFAQEKVEKYKKMGFKKIIELEVKKSLEREDMKVTIGILNYNYGKNNREIWIEF